MISDADGIDHASTRPRVISHLLESAADIPNNPRLPLLAYPGAVRLPRRDPAAVFEKLFASNGWVGSWRNGIFPFHHFHSTAHEVLGVYAGTAVVQLGGETGITLTLHPGDVVIIPAGVGHKRLSSGGGLGVVGAYPSGQRADMCRPDTAACAVSAEQVARTFIPPRDPVHGADGPLGELWGQ